MQQKQSSLERQALLLFYGPILLSNVINEHVNFTHYINSACVRVNVWGCVWLLVASIQWAKAFACLWPSLCSFFPISISLFSHRVVVHRAFSFPWKWLNECWWINIVWFHNHYPCLWVKARNRRTPHDLFACSVILCKQILLVWKKWLYGQKTLYKVALLPEPHCSLCIGIPWGIFVAVCEFALQWFTTKKYFFMHFW